MGLPDTVQPGATTVQLCSCAAVQQSESKRPLAVRKTMRAMEGKEAKVGFNGCCVTLLHSAISFISPFRRPRYTGT